MTQSASPTHDHQLLDAGDERRLERFGDRVVDRPAPVAIGPRRDRPAWGRATIRFDKGTGWTGPAAQLTPWTVEVAGLAMECRPTTAGQLGLFPEHAAGIDWLERQVRSGAGVGAGRDGRPLVLNLFGHTGLATLALARAGAEVVHVDAARPAVAWARHNATLNRLEGAPIRWIVDEAVAFCARELRRGRRYDGVVLDPPSYGHGAGGRAWRLEEDLPALLADCASLTGGEGFCLLTAHTPDHGPDRLADLLSAAYGRRPAGVEAGDLELRASSGAILPLGAFARLAG